MSFLLPEGIWLKFTETGLITASRSHRPKHTTQLLGKGMFEFRAIELSYSAQLALNVQHKGGGYRL